jgi:hypothetical protein
VVLIHIDPTDDLKGEVMVKKANKKPPAGEAKARKLKVNKSTLKDLDSQNSSQLKGGARKTGQDSCYVRTCL